MNKPKVLVTRNIFPEWINYISDNSELDLWEDELPPPRDVLLNIANQRQHALRNKHC